jgi:acetyl-CoA carboxylase carboxyl transferase subunit beta
MRRSPSDNDSALTPEDLRVAQRGMALAQSLRLPLVTLIDTSGAELSAAAELDSLSAEIARSIAIMTRLPQPTLSVLLGQGTGGAALALLGAGRVLAAENAWLSPLPLEGASVIVYGDSGHAPELADAMGVTAPALKRLGIVHRIIPEPVDAATDPDAFILRTAHAIAAELSELTGRTNPPIDPHT